MHHSLIHTTLCPITTPELKAVIVARVPFALNKAISSALILYMKLAKNERLETRKASGVILLLSISYRTNKNIS